MEEKQHSENQIIQGTQYSSAAQASAVTVTNGNAEAKSLPQELDLVELFFMLLNNWKTLLLGTFIGAVLLAGYQTFCIVPTYQASTELYITSNDSMISLQDLQIGTALAEDYRFIVTSRSVLKSVIEEMDLNMDCATLKKMITVTNPTGTHIIRTSVTTTDMELSRDIANTLLNTSIHRIYQVVGTNEPTIIDYSEAEAVQDVTPGFVRFTATGAILGFLCVTIVLTLKMLLNTTIRTDEDVQKYLNLPVLTAVPLFED